jgi:quercetin dioxygenase-like cupin family protein
MSTVRLVPAPTVVPAPGAPPKVIEEFVGRVNTGTREASLARMRSPQGWSEPGQTPEFDEYTLVLSGTLRLETRYGVIDVQAGQAVIAPRGQWVRYSTPDAPAEYVAVCVPAFAPSLVHRDEI